MWLIYEAESWPKATGAYSAIERMRRQFTALALEADHETVYGLGRWHSEAYLQYLVNVTFGMYVSSLHLRVTFEFMFKVLLLDLTIQALDFFMELEFAYQREDGWLAITTSWMHQVHRVRSSRGIENSIGKY
ncbi:hypothetical protein FQA39_LY08841 [Lamprigera yunnana]|nr:hypothetical protein FQA39_LY08841 [Lamprigera yunnana]